MCGIIGEYRFDSKQIDKKEFDKKLESIKHRGPDGNGVWSNNSCMLGHVRLSIIDLSDTGAQPMVSDQKNVLSFNGEIYNFQTLKEELDKSIIFKGSSDTEVLLNLLEQRDLNVLNRLRGMFAFAYWDASTDELLLVRDQIGIKPLYYHVNEDRIVFSSEIKAILSDKDYQVGVDEEALKEHILLGFSLEDRTIFKGIRRLKPGHLLKVTKKGIVEEEYFSMADFVSSSENNRQTIDDCLKDSVKIHSISDVKLGMMLSGGVDSNLLLNHLNETNSLDDDFIAYNAGVENKDEIRENEESLFSERFIAKMMSNKMGIDLVNIDIKPDSFISIEKFVEINEEPVCNPSGFLINEICQRARLSSNKVLFSGHGGDELFAGYRRHVAAKIISDFRGIRWIFKLIPPLSNLPSEFFRLFDAIKNKNRQFFTLSSIGLQGLTKDSIFKEDFITSQDVEKIANRFEQPAKNIKLSILKKTMLLEFNGYLGSQNLINMDKFSMANSIEVRVPFLNLDVIKKGFSIPDKILIQGYKNKSTLRQLARKKLPKEVFKQKKSGFGPSLSKILRSDEVFDLLCSNTTQKRGIINTKGVANILKEDLSPAHTMQLLNLAFIEQWFRIFIDQ